MSVETMVPVGPFADWLAGYVAGVGLQAARDTLGLGGERTNELLEPAVGATVGIAAVDRYLTRADTATTLATLYPAGDQGGRVDRGRSYVCDEQTLIRAHTMHLDGMSVRAVARELFDECFSASPAALAMALTTAWHGRGWEVRGQREATKQANRARATRPYCEHIHALGKRRGQRCDRRAKGNDRWCWHHHPDRIAVGIQQVRAGAAV